MKVERRRRRRKAKWRTWKREAVDANMASLFAWIRPTAEAKGRNSSCNKEVRDGKEGRKKERKRREICLQDGGAGIECLAILIKLSSFLSSTIISSGLHFHYLLCLFRSAWQKWLFFAPFSHFCFTFFVSSFFS